ncbi:MAG: 3-oxoadipyl-CoA thiolase, partial [Myxococcales bacterium]|nr:3-oxoadipyl-CoA thiolase [Myxococcales bacterium]
MTSDARTPVIVAAVRTPIGRFRGALAAVRPDDLAAHVIRSLAEHYGAAIEQLADVYLG